MKIFRKTLSEYVAFTWWVFYVLFIIALFRLMMGTVGLSVAVGDKLTSLMFGSMILVVFLAAKSYNQRFGGWKEVIILALVVSVFTQFIISMGIMLYPLYDWATYFHDPGPYAVHKHPLDPSIHILGHLTIGTIVQTIILSIVGVATVAILGKIRPRSEIVISEDSQFELIAVKGGPSEEEVESAPESVE